MTDLYLGFTLICGASVLLFVGSVRLSYRLPLTVTDFLAVVVVAGLLYYIRQWWYDVRLAAILPVSNLIIVGNWLPLLAALLGGFAWRRIPGRIVRKSLSVVALSTAAAYSAVLPMLGTAPKRLNVWDDDGICMQTTESTCTAACAATLLRFHGIEASEGEMAELCLTRKGTTWMGLYRGLKAKTAGTRWEVEVLECNAIDLLCLPQTPRILSVGLSEDASDRTRNKFSEWGWRPGQGHSVLLLEQMRQGDFRVADPTPGYGIEYWNREDISNLFQGTAIRLVERS